MLYLYCLVYLFEGIWPIAVDNVNSSHLNIKKQPKSPAGDDNGTCLHFTMQNFEILFLKKILS